MKKKIQILMILKLYDYEMKEKQSKTLKRQKNCVQL